MKKAYTYVRSASQHGASDSLRRQHELTQTYANENDLEIIETVQDSGVSGYRNHTEGALAGLIEQIESGAVEPGSYLLIESLDRLSRDSWAVVELLTRIVRRGVMVVTVENGQVFDTDRSIRGGLRLSMGRHAVWSITVQPDIVRRICREYAAGASPLEIARRLNGERDTRAAQRYTLARFVDPRASDG